MCTARDHLGSARDSDDLNSHIAVAEGPASLLFVWSSGFDFVSPSLETSSRQATKCSAPSETPCSRYVEAKPLAVKATGTACKAQGLPRLGSSQP